MKIRSVLAGIVNRIAWNRPALTTSDAVDKAFSHLKGQRVYPMDRLVNATMQYLEGPAAKGRVASFDMLFELSERMFDRPAYRLTYLALMTQKLAEQGLIDRKGFLAGMFERCGLKDDRSGQASVVRTMMLGLEPLGVTKNISPSGPPAKFVSECAAILKELYPTDQTEQKSMLRAVAEELYPRYHFSYYGNGFQKNERVLMVSVQRQRSFFVSIAPELQINVSDLVRDLENEGASLLPRK
jgi:hypothetical protein